MYIYLCISYISHFLPDLRHGDLSYVYLCLRPLIMHRHYRNLRFNDGSERLDRERSFFRGKDITTIAVDGFAIVVVRGKNECTLWISSGIKSGISLLLSVLLHITQSHTLIP